MKIEVIDPLSGAVTEINVSQLNKKDVDEINAISHSDNEIDQFIANLDISADAKSILKKLSTLTLKVGRTLIKVGKRILDTIIILFNNYPNAGIGALLGLLLGAIIFSIPVIGTLIGSLITPLAVAFGFIVGATEDIKNKALAKEISKATKIFQPLVK